MNQERDKFLTEAMGCRVGLFVGEDGYTKQHNPFDFSTWDGFGKLWEWATCGNFRSFSRHQDWWGEFLRYHQPRFISAAYVESGGCDLIPTRLLGPDCFADAVYIFLKEIPL